MKPCNASAHGTCNTTARVLHHAIFGQMPTHVATSAPTPAGFPFKVGDSLFLPDRPEYGVPLYISEGRTRMGVVL